MAYGTVNVPGVTTSELTAAVNEVRGERKDSVGGYIWKADTDKVYSKDAGGSFSVEHGSLADCKTDEYRGVWFRVQSSSSSAGIVAYDTKYTIDGANNYLSIGDYVIWTGSALVHVPTYEAKASTVRNSDGQFAYHSGVDGLMSSTDKAYLTFLMQHFMAASMSGAFNSGDGTNESGLYGNVTLGRPSGSGEGDTYNMMSILDKVTNYTSQLLINESANNPFAYFRGRISGAWQRILGENDLVSHMAVAENDSDYPNWDNELRIYHVKKWAASSADLPNSSWSSTGDYLVVNIPGAPNATTLHARTQFVMNNSNMEIWCRFIPSYSGSGSLAGGSPTAWVRLSGGLGHSHSNKTELDSITSTLISNWNAAYSHISNTNNPHRTNKSDVGLGNADNTSDMSKPVSNPQKEYINRYSEVVLGKLLGYTEIQCLDADNNGGHATGNDISTIAPGVENLLLTHLDYDYLTTNGNDTSYGGGSTSRKICNYTGRTITVRLPGVQTGEAGVPEGIYGDHTVEDGSYIIIDGSRMSNPPLPLYNKTGEGKCEFISDMAKIVAKVK